MTVDMSDWMREETETRRAWKASMEPLLKSLADSNAVLLKIISEQERLRQPPEKPPLTAAAFSPD
jgi:predicted transcriptional regulator